jgi:hypothetical protein
MLTENDRHRLAMPWMALGNPWDPGDLGELGLAAKAWLNIAARAGDQNFWSWFCPIF